MKTFEPAIEAEKLTDLFSSPLWGQHTLQWWVLAHTRLMNPEAFLMARWWCEAMVSNGFYGGLWCFAAMEGSAFERFWVAPCGSGDGSEPWSFLFLRKATRLPRLPLPCEREVWLPTRRLFTSQVDGLKPFQRYVQFRQLASCLSPRKVGK